MGCYWNGEEDSRLLTQMLRLALQECGKKIIQPQEKNYHRRNRDADGTFLVRVSDTACGTWISEQLQISLSRCTDSQRESAS